MKEIPNYIKKVAGSALDIQIGGNHYSKLKIQPMEYSMANGLDACQHTIVKYVTRFRDKAGAQDLEKARHVIDMLIEFETKKASDVALALQNEGVLVNAANPTTIRFAPALIVTDAQLKKFVSIFKKVMSDGK